MSLSLSLKQTQKLALTPQLQQALKVLQLPTQDLIQEINQRLQENPFLSVEEEKESSERNGEEKPELLWESGYSSEADSEDWDWQESPQSLYAYLLEQLRCLKIDRQEMIRVEWLIGALDQDGILTEPLESLSESFPAKNSFTLAQWENSLRILQSFDPPGVGASSKVETLVLQLRQLKETEDSKLLSLAQKALESYLDLLAKHQVNKLKKLLDCSDEDIKRVFEIVSSLDPHPTSSFSNSEINFVIPEIRVEKHKDSWSPVLLRHVPKVRLNNLYADACRSIQDESDFQIWKGKLDEARQFIKSLEQRQSTLLNISRLIVDYQQPFFDFGPERLRPLVLREIADELGIHESTVSRVTNGKFLVCPKGTFELKFFFSSAHYSSGTSCEEVSAKAIRAELMKIIETESPLKPYSDAKLSELLQAKGYDIARRTVAKYRELSGIPAASLRKKL